MSILEFELFRFIGYKLEFICIKTLYKMEFEVI